MDLLIYGSAIFAGIIGSRYLNRLANFCLMVAVFQLDLAILVSVMSGELRLRLLMPYTVVAIIPAMAGIIGGKYLGNVGNALRRHLGLLRRHCTASPLRDWKVVASASSWRSIHIGGKPGSAAGLHFGRDSGLSAPATPRLKRKPLLGNRGGSNSEVNVSGQDFITKSSPFQPLSWHRIQLQPSPSVKGLALSRR